MVHHLMNELDDAIVRYHEVRHTFSTLLSLVKSRCVLTTNRMRDQTLSIDPINGHILELLNLALDSNAGAGPLGQKGIPGGEEEWSKQMREHRKKGKAAEKARATVGDDEMSM